MKNFVQISCSDFFLFLHSDLQDVSVHLRMDELCISDYTINWPKLCTSIISIIISINQLISLK